MGLECCVGTLVIDLNLHFICNTSIGLHTVVLWRNGTSDVRLSGGSIVGFGDDGLDIVAGILLGVAHT